MEELDDLRLWICAESFGEQVIHRPPVSIHRQERSDFLFDF
jgi:hypothetical protein